MNQSERKKDKCEVPNVTYLGTRTSTREDREHGCKLVRGDNHAHILIQRTKYQNIGCDQTGECCYQHYHLFFVRAMKREGISRGVLVL